MKQNFDYKLEQYRGTLKQIIKVRGLRTISIANYLNWLEDNGYEAGECSVHSLKLDVQDGYINAFGYGENGRCGAKIEDADARAYQCARKYVNDLLKREHEIPYKVRKNILVRVAR